ncbi:MAG: F0F1 ATP synthase subunit delta [Veillonellaceae bacterium]|jgi:F-type H+-transporting ATPase subunit delta|nr:F0F1 ATP synthase subunit delta [Veillonellaceae bacterium]
MLNDQLAIKYAQALYELAGEKEALPQAEQQLTELEQVLATNAELATFLYHPQVEAQAKKEVLAAVFDGELAEFVHNFLLLVIDKRRETILPAIFREFKRILNEARNIIEAEVTTAFPLSDAEHNSLAQKLGTVTGKTVILNTKIDSSILGGVIVKIGDKLIDGSVARQLKTLKTALINAPGA